MNNYGIWLSFNNQEEGFQIPVNPPEVEISEEGNGNTYDITGLGQINVIKSPNLTEVSFESFFPAMPYHFVVAPTLLEPMRYVSLINKWRATKRPIRFVYTGSTFDINIAASIENFTWREVAGTTGDIEYSLSLKKYIFYSAKKVKVEENEDGTAKTMKVQDKTRPNDKQQPKTYTLAAGDNLWKVAQKHLGDSSRAKEIQELNNLKDSDLKKLPIGLELKLPQGAAS